MPASLSWTLGPPITIRLRHPRRRTRRTTSSVNITLALCAEKPSHRPGPSASSATNRSMNALVAGPNVSL